MSYQSGLNRTSNILQPTLIGYSGFQTIEYVRTIIVTIGMMYWITFRSTISLTRLNFYALIVMEIYIYIYIMFCNRIEFVLKPIAQDPHKVNTVKLRASMKKVRQIAVKTRNCRYHYLKALNAQ